MEKIYLLNAVYTSLNCADLKGTKNFNFYPQVAGSKEQIEKNLNSRIKEANKNGCNVTELSSREINAGSYFERVVRIDNPIGGPTIFGISHVCEAL